MIISVNVYLEHYGIKGQRWGVRKEQAITVGKKVSVWSKNHPKQVATIALGASFVALNLRGKNNINETVKVNSQQVKQISKIGKTGLNSLFYSLPKLGVKSVSRGLNMVVNS